MTEGGAVREAVGVFHDRPDLEAAIDELLSSGFDRAEVSLLASQEAVEQKLGHSYRSVRELEDDPDVPTVAYLPRESVGEIEGAIVGALIYVGAVAAAGAVVASGGAFAAAIAAAAAGGGGGGLLGYLLDRYVEKRYLKSIAEQIARGGLLLWVHIRDEAHERRAVDILTRNGGEDVHVHDLPAGEKEAQRMRARISSLVDEAGRQSFPASDPPGFNPGRSGGPH